MANNASDRTFVPTPYQPHPREPTLTAGDAAKVLFKRVREDEFFQVPSRAHPGDAGYDLTVSRTVTVAPFSFAEIPTNTAVCFPTGVWGMILGRSSAFYKKFLNVHTCVIDWGFRGELFCMVYNLKNTPVAVRKGERVSQLILMNLVTPEVAEVAGLPPGDRGEAGFGSTGE